jgi:hypothetical protein
VRTQNYLTFDLKEEPNHMSVEESPTKENIIYLAATKLSAFYFDPAQWRHMI